MTTTPVANPHRFRETGVAIGEAVDVQASGAVTFPIQIALSYDPLEPRLKGVPPELIQAFFFDESTHQWSTQGLTPTQHDLSTGTLNVETTHLTVFRLGVPRGQPPLVHDLRPPATGANARLTLLGYRFSGPASQNLLTAGGAYVGISLDANGTPRPLDLGDSGETLILQDADGRELDRAELTAPPERRGSWTRQQDATGAVCSFSIPLDCSLQGPR